MITSRGGRLSAGHRQRVKVFKRMSNRVTIPDSDYPCILSWHSDCIAKADLVYNEYNATLASALMDWEYFELDQRVKELKQLPNDSFARILTAPDTYQRLVEACRGATGQLERFLMYAIGVELARHGYKRPEATTRWSATGDYYFSPSELGPSNGLVSATANQWRLYSSYQSPYLAERIPLDFRSIFARRPMPVAAFRPIKWV